MQRSGGVCGGGVCGGGGMRMGMHVRSGGGCASGTQEMGALALAGVGAPAPGVGHVCRRPMGHILRAGPCRAVRACRSWDIARSGELTEAAAVDKAHEGRVAACALSACGTKLYSASYDGALKAWDTATLALLHEARGAHEGSKVSCIRVGADGIVYSGGDDNVSVQARECVVRLGG